MDWKTLARYFFNLRVVGGAIVLGTLLAGSVLAALWFTRPQTQIDDHPTAVMEVIPFSTVTPSPSVTPSPQPSPTNAAGIPPAPGDIRLGALVQVSGTGGDGLRIRSTPGLQGSIRFLGLEAEVFRVTDGPEQADGFSWWLVEALYDPTLSGWAVSNYLLVVQEP